MYSKIASLANWTFLYIIFKVHKRLNTTIHKIMSDPGKDYKKYFFLYFSQNYIICWFSSVLPTLYFNKHVYPKCT